ncbi:hypothetical protein AAFF_G00243220 [Aldrovandia affinis]|uniref:Uncharacterized protein n=1 Tax=Aldrovandia affinis TaxID=143900 RepID=A0AAD7W319_9TELE|nr:hypothetical protein AAFF_G00243220 [Aldrovandia affinis]
MRARDPCHNESVSGSLQWTTRPVFGRAHLFCIRSHPSGLVRRAVGHLSQGLKSYISGPAQVRAWKQMLPALPSIVSLTVNPTSTVSSDDPPSPSLSVSWEEDS